MARRPTRFVRPQPRTKVWIGAGVGLTSINVSTKQLISVLSAAALAFRPFTILRTRMLLSWMSDQDAANETPEGDVGIMVVTETVSTIGVTAVPDPSSTDGDVDADWFVHQPVFQRLSFSSGVGFNVVDRQYVIDSKAMRKVGPTDDIVTVSSETGGFGAFLSTRGRMLIQLH